MEEFTFDLSHRKTFFQRFIDFLTSIRNKLFMRKIHTSYQDISSHYNNLSLYDEL